MQSEPAQWHMRWKGNQKWLTKRSCSLYILRYLKKATLPWEKKNETKNTKLTTAS